jgi:hemerythrin-like domain-containing protein
VTANKKAPGAMTREMVMVHTAFRREFGLMPELVRGVAAGDRARAAVVADHIELIGDALHHHHSGEDRVIWPALLERCPDSLAPLINLMEEHHERIADLGGRLAKAVAEWRTGGDPAARDSAAQVLDDLLPALHEHLGMEEERVMPLVEEHITADEWDGMVAEAGATTPQDKLALMFGIMMYEGEPAAVQDALANMPAEMRPIIAEVGPQAYAAYAQIVYGTTTP